MMGFGMLSFTVAGLFLHRQHDVKRMFSYSSIEHMGLITFGFGVGGPLATFGALLHMTVHSITKSAIFVTVGHACQLAGTQRIDQIRGLIRTQPAIGWGAAAGHGRDCRIPALWRIHQRISAADGDHEGLAVADDSAAGRVGVAFAGLFRHVQKMVFGEPPPGQKPVEANMLPVVVHLVLVLWLGWPSPASCRAGSSRPRCSSRGRRRYDAAGPAGTGSCAAWRKQVCASRHKRRGARAGATCAGFARGLEPAR